MSWYRRKSIALLAASLSVAAVLGSSLGVVAAGTKPQLYTGYNIVGGPFGGDVQPSAYLACLPANSWSAFYQFDGETQTWKHYYANVPAYVNAAESGGITMLKRFQGGPLIMNTTVTNPQLKDTASEACTG